MHKSYKYGGARIRDFKNPNMNSLLKLDVYNKQKTKSGLEIIKKKTLDNRISYLCPNIQKLKE